MILKSSQVNQNKIKSISYCVSKLIINCFSTANIKTYIENHNLKFDAYDWTVNLTPLHPEVYKKKGNNVYEISNRYPVLVINFLKKGLDFKMAWEKRKLIMLKFQEAGLLSTVQLKTGKQAHIISITDFDKKQFKLTDLPSQQKVKIQLKLLQKIANNLGTKTGKAIRSQTNNNQDKIQTYMPYNQYRVMHKLIQKSLFEFSGSKFIMQVQKKQNLQKWSGKAQTDKQVDQVFRNQ